MFKYHIEYKPSKLPAPEFSHKAGARDVTLDWHGGTVKNLLAKPHRFDELIESAKGYIATVPVMSTRARKVEITPQTLAPVLDEPSSPIAPMSDAD